MTRDFDDDSLPHDAKGGPSRELAPVESSRPPARRRTPTAELMPLSDEPPPERQPFHIQATGELSPHRSLCMARRPDSPAAQQYRLLQFKLREGGNPRLIGVTSAEVREGKTTAAANLALALAEGRQVRIMLLDLNLRRPALARRFGLSLLGSIADQVRLHQRDPDAPWQVHELRSSLHLMAGGEGTENPAPLLNSSLVGVLFNLLAAYYDYVVVDLPAILAGADVGSTQDYLDGLLLVCRGGVSRRSQIRQATDQLGTRRLVGVLLLDMDMHAVSG